MLRTDNSITISGQLTLEQKARLRKGIDTSIQILEEARKQINSKRKGKHINLTVEYNRDVDIKDIPHDGYIEHKPSDYFDVDIQIRNLSSKYTKISF